MKPKKPKVEIEPDESEDEEKIRIQIGDVSITGMGNPFKYKRMITAIVSNKQVKKYLQGFERFKLLKTAMGYADYVG